MEAFIQGCKLFYRYIKSDSSETILFLHGWGCDGSVFNAFEKDFSANASVVSVDFPGHGQSGDPKEPWGVPEYAEQIRLLLKEIGVAKVHIVAHSFGGRVAIWLSSHYPELIDKMVLTGAAGIRKQDSSAPSKRQKQYKTLKALVNVIARVPFLRGITGRMHEALVQKYGSPDYKRLNPEMRKTFVKVITQDLSGYLSSIKASTLLIWGANDTETPLWMGKQMEKDIPDAGLVVFDGRTHFAFLEEAQRFLVIVKTFLWGGKA